eukprot:7952411-Alexandrium_andersonii.AAC.1
MGSAPLPLRRRAPGHVRTLALLGGLAGRPDHARRRVRARGCDEHLQDVHPGEIDRPRRLAVDDPASAG